MPQPPLSDELAAEAADAVRRHGSVAGAARALAIPYSTFRHRYDAAVARGFHLSAGVRDALDSVQIHHGEARGGWRKIKDPETGSFNSVYFRVSPPAPEQIAEQIAGVLNDIRTAEAVEPPQLVASDLINLVAISDAHIGMMSWARETGEDWDTRRGCERLVSWVSSLVSRLPDASTCVILTAGDLLHADSYVAETPISKHRLDVDTRYPKIIEMTISALVCCIDKALARHERVVVRILPGNHDPNATVALRVALSAYYRNESRVVVVSSASEFFVHQFGQVMIAAHHGHRAKPNRLVHFIADEYAAIWGKTRYRYLFTGHFHSFRSDDIGGVKWEQLPAMVPRDAWSYGGAWVQRCRMFGITYHRDKGEQVRVSVSP